MIKIAATIAVCVSAVACSAEPSGNFPIIVGNHFTEQKSTRGFIIFEGTPICGGRRGLLMPKTSGRLGVWCSDPGTFISTSGTRWIVNGVDFIGEDFSGDEDEWAASHSAD